MHSTQNERINQITFSTLVVGVDIKHVARAQDFRGVEFGKLITFENNPKGFELFVSWFWEISTDELNFRTLSLAWNQRVTTC